MDRWQVSPRRGPVAGQSCPRAGSRACRRWWRREAALCPCLPGPSCSGCRGLGGTDGEAGVARWQGPWAAELRQDLSLACPQLRDRRSQETDC